MPTPISQLSGHSTRRLGSGSVALTLFLLLAGCGGTPIRGNLEPPRTPSPSSSTAAPAPAAETAPAVVEATVTAAPVAGSGVVYRIHMKLPKGVNEVSVVIPEPLSPAAPPAPFTPAPGGEKECSEGFFSCSKLVFETISAAVAAIIALFGLYKLLRKTRSRR